MTSGKLGADVFRGPLALIVRVQGVQRLTWATDGVWKLDVGLRQLDLSDFGTRQMVAALATINAPLLADWRDSLRSALSRSDSELHRHWLGLVESALNPSDLNTVIMSQRSGTRLHALCVLAEDPADTHLFTSPGVEAIVADLEASTVSTRHGELHGRRDLLDVLSRLPEKFRTQALDYSTEWPRDIAAALARDREVGM